MKMVNSTDAAADVLSELVRSNDHYIGEDADANKVAVDTTRVVVSDPEAYREYLLSQRNRAILALDQLGIKHDFSTTTPDLSPRVS